MPSGINLRISGSRFASIQVHASGKLLRVVTTRHFLGVTNSMCKNHDFQMR